MDSERDAARRRRRWSPLRFVLHRTRPIHAATDVRVLWAAADALIQTSYFLQEIVDNDPEGPVNFPDEIRNAARGLLLALKPLLKVARRINRETYARVSPT